MKRNIRFVVTPLFCCCFVRKVTRLTGKIEGCWSLLWIVTSATTRLERSLSLIFRLSICDRGKKKKQEKEKRNKRLSLAHFRGKESEVKGGKGRHTIFMATLT